MTDIALAAMQFAVRVHAHQKRKYTGVPYATHLAEVAGIVATVAHEIAPATPLVPIAVAWLHDCVEDMGVSAQELYDRFGPQIMRGVMALSDIEFGNRVERKAASRARLAAADGWVQTIKCADLISNTSSIVQLDPKFAVVYIAEKRALLDVMTKAHKGLHRMAFELANQEPSQ